MLDDEFLDAFRGRADEEGIGYQTLISLILREHLARRPVDEQALRRILREELDSAARGARRAGLASAVPAPA